MQKKKGLVRTMVGDVLRINITPATSKRGPDRPWGKIYRHPHGIRHKGVLTSDQIEASKGMSRTAVARLIGEEVIRSSKVLTQWFHLKK